jgi:glycine/D-amino acid oxidase-like deaminating enzyme
MDHEVIVVGAGLAGLSCARTIAAAGIDVSVVEKSNGVGGRVRTDSVDGYRLDRGFQILLTAYPELDRWFDLDALDFRRFRAGANVWTGSRFARVGDPLRRPADLVSTLRAPIGSFADKLRVLQLVASVRKGKARNLLSRPDMTTMARLERGSFSPAMIDRFFRPLFAGIQLDPALEVSSRRFEMIMRMLAVGDTGVPALGMGTLSETLAAPLPDGSVQLNRAVLGIDSGRVSFADGGSTTARVVVVATDGPTASTLAPVTDPGSRSVAALWFGADEPPLAGPVLALDGAASGPVKNFAVMTEVSPAYAPQGRHLAVAAVPGGAARSSGLEAESRSQLRSWFGPVVDHWDLLRIDRIEHAQPNQEPPFSPKKAVRVDTNLFVCGDHRDTASIQGALFSGRRTAEAVLAELANGS